MKRVRKAKADGLDSVAIADDGPSREQIPGAHSILEISGPTIPSPGPSGTLCGIILISSVIQTSMKAGKKSRADELGSSEVHVCVLLFLGAGRWRDYTSLGWPGPEECQRTRRIDLTIVTSTWLAVSVKNIE